MFGTRKFIQDYTKIERYIKINKLDTALSIVDKYANLETLDRYDNEIIFKYYIAKAQILAKQGKLDEARQIVDYLRLRFKHARYTDYIDYYVSLPRIEGYYGSPRQ
jgi:hypothetical protein